MSFLNEVMERYPSAISLAPGAPYPGFLKILDVPAYIERYIKYVCDEDRVSRDHAWNRLLSYGPSRGIINELVSRYLSNDENIAISPNEIVITVGCQESLLIVLRALFSSASDTLVVFSPCYVGVLGAARLLDIRTHAIDIDQFDRALHELKRLCRPSNGSGTKVRAIYLAPDFSNPSGDSLTIENRRAILDFAQNNNILLLEDTAYRFTADPDGRLPSLMELDESGQVILLGTFAKTCVPGARVGFVATPLRSNYGGTSTLLADDLAAIKSMVTINTSPICQAIIGGILLENDCSLKASANIRGDFYRNNMQTLLQALDEYVPNHIKQRISWNAPAGGFFVRMNLRRIVNEAMLELSASKYGVLWTPLSYFSGAPSTELRLSCSYLPPAEIREGVRRLARFLENALVMKTPALPLRDVQ